MCRRWCFRWRRFGSRRGELRHYATESEAGGRNLRGFCPTCGSRLTGVENAERGIIGVVASSLDDPSLFVPRMDFYVADAQPWDVLDETVTKLPGGLKR